MENSAVFGVFGFNPWYVGGGVKSGWPLSLLPPEVGFNPWYVGGGVKRLMLSKMLLWRKRFNPWYVGGGVKRQCAIDKTTLSTKFQSLVCWRGC